CRAARVSPYRPFLVGRIARSIAAAGRDDRCSGALLQELSARFAGDSGGAAADSVRSGFSGGAALTLQGTALRNGEFRPLWRDIRPTSQGTEAVVAEARARLRWNGGPRVMAVVEGLARSGRRNEPMVRAGVFRSTDRVVDFGDAYVNGQLGPVVLSFGRANEAWLGEGRESLALSANGPLLDRLLVSVNWSRFEVRALISTINDVELTDDLDALPPGASLRYHRYLLGHALTWRPSRAVEISVGETALLQREEGGISLNFANPLMLYLVSQNDEGRQEGDANLTAFAGVRVSTGRLTLHGEFLLDDILIDSEDRDFYPDQLGWRLEGTVALPLRFPAAIGASYERLSSYTYLGEMYSKTYQQYDEPIGSELGPDAHRLRGFGELWITPRVQLSGGLSFWERGALRIDQRPSPDRFGHAREPYPSVSAARPSPQEALLADGSVRWLTATLPVTLRAELARVENVNNVSSGTQNYLRVQLIGSYRFRYP
ncbi:MAG: capsule assembly Wzi family protein, partial [Gemmatimonadaceae bacterium]